jgi:hypothetical protein
LAGAIETSPKASNVIDAVSVLSPCAIVATIRRVASVPLIALLWIADDDIHRDASAVELPSRVLLDPSYNPACDPSTVTLDAPVIALFTITIELAAVPAIEIAAVIVPTRTDTVAAAITVRSTPAEPLHCTEVDATHSVLVLVVTPTRYTALQRDPPTFVPTMVTLVAPVEATFVVTEPLDSTESCVNAAVVLATSTCTVSDTVLTASTLADDLTTTLVSDTHVVAAIDVWPTRATRLRA